MSPASVIPEPFTSTGVPADFTTFNAGAGVVTGVEVVEGPPLTVPPSGSVPDTVAEFRTDPVDSSASVTV